MDEDQYPEHAKMKAIDEGEKDAITEFLEWLFFDKEYVVARYMDDSDSFFDGLTTVCATDPGTLLADFYHIDLKKIDNEKDQMIQAIRERHDAERKDDPSPKQTPYIEGG